MIAVSIAAEWEGWRRMLKGEEGERWRREGQEEIKQCEQAEESCGERFRFHGRSVGETEWGHMLLPSMEECAKGKWARITDHVNVHALWCPSQEAQRGEGESDVGMRCR